MKAICKAGEEKPRPDEIFDEQVLEARTAGVGCFARTISAANAFLIAEKH